jgi:16S rRNA (uracil1498-N3)-methyltransferase
VSYFLTDQKLAEGASVELSGDEARHILLARRMKKGEKFNLQGKDEKRYLVNIIEIERNSLKVKVISEIKTPPEQKVKITLFQSFVNEKALDFIFQKSTELGAHKIILFNSQNTATKLAEELFKKKHDRWQKILWEAAKQSDRVHPPGLEYLKSVDDVIKSSKEYGQLFLCDIAGQSPKNLVNLDQSFSARGGSASGGKSYGIIVGPEGGFTAEEVEGFKILPNCVPITLGPILLRAETATLASLSIISNLYKNE